MDDNKQLQKGFNAGYLLAKHRPKLLQALKNGLQKTEDPYVLGLLAGSDEYAKENKSMTKSKQFSKIKNQIHQNYQLKKKMDKEDAKPELEKDQDSREPEIDVDV